MGRFRHILRERVRSLCRDDLFFRIMAAFSLSLGASHLLHFGVAVAISEALEWQGVQSHGRLQTIGLVRRSADR